MENMDHKPRPQLRHCQRATDFSKLDGLRTIFDRSILLIEPLVGNLEAFAHETTSRRRNRSNYSASARLLYRQTPCRHPQTKLLTMIHEDPVRARQDEVSSERVELKEKDEW